jgi:hypothetical protein
MSTNNVCGCILDAGGMSSNSIDIAFDFTSPVNIGSVLTITDANPTDLKSDFIYPYLLNTIGNPVTLQSTPQPTLIDQCLCITDTKTLEAQWKRINAYGLQSNDVNVANNFTSPVNIGSVLTITDANPSDLKSDFIYPYLLNTIGNPVTLQSTPQPTLIDQCLCITDTKTLEAQWKRINAYGLQSNGVNVANNFTSPSIDQCLCITKTSPLEASWKTISGGGIDVEPYSIVGTDADGKVAIEAGIYGLYNTVIGRATFTHALNATADGNLNSYNVVLGNEVGSAFSPIAIATQGINNVLIGRNIVNTGSSYIGNSNVGIGNDILSVATTGNNNTCVGGNILAISETGEFNTIIGRNILQNGSVLTNNNVIIGFNNFEKATACNDNIAIGNYLFTNSDTLDLNIAIGNRTLENIYDGISIGIGNAVLRKLTNGNSIGIGDEVLQNFEAGDNIGIGNRALTTTTTGTRNVAIGEENLLSNTIGGGNVAIGYWSMRKNTEGLNNIGIGLESLDNNIIGSSNIGIGLQSLEKIENLSNNVALGNNAGPTLDASDTICLGHNATVNGSNKLGIGNIAIDNGGPVNPPAYVLPITIAGKEYGLALYDYP